VVGAALVLAGLLAGLLSAQALGEVGLPVTVTLPTISLPVPVTPAAPPPAPPAPPTPPIPPVPTAPAVRAPTHPSPVPVNVTPSASPAPAPAPAPAPSSEPPERSTGGTGYTQGSSFSSSSRTAKKPRQPASISRRARLIGIRARPQRVTRGKRHEAAQITFTLSAPGRVAFVVRGPAPSCGVAGRFTVRGHSGTNHVRFTGRVGRRNLPHGTYRITAQMRRRPPSRSIVVFVGERTAPGGFVCTANRPSLNAFASIFGTFSNGTGALGASGAGKTATRDRVAEKDVRKPKDEPYSGVLPSVTDRLKGLPAALPMPSMAGPTTSPPWILGAGAIVLLAVSALALVFYVFRFFGRPRTN
jgi:hypothetical protein